MPPNSAARQTPSAAGILSKSSAHDGLHGDRDQHDDGAGHERGDGVAEHLAAGPHPVGDGLQVQPQPGTLDAVLVAGLRAAQQRAERDREHRARARGPPGTARRRSAPPPSTTASGASDPARPAAGPGRRPPAWCRRRRPRPRCSACAVPAGADPSVVDGTVVRLLAQRHRPPPPGQRQRRQRDQPRPAPPCPTRRRRPAAAARPARPGGVQCSTEAARTAPRTATALAVAAGVVDHARRKPCTARRSRSRRPSRGPGRAGCVINADIEVDAARDSTTHMHQLHDRADQRDRQHRPRHAERDRRARAARSCSPPAGTRSARSPAARAAGSAAGAAAARTACGSTVSSTPKATSGVSTQPTSCSANSGDHHRHGDVRQQAAATPRPTAQEPEQRSTSTTNSDDDARPWWRRWRRAAGW